MYAFLTVLTPSVVEQKEPIKSCLRFDKLIVLNSLSSPAASPKRVSKGAAHRRRLLPPLPRAKPGCVPQRHAKLKRAGLLRLQRLSGSFGFGDWAAGVNSRLNDT